MARSRTENQIKGDRAERRVAWYLRFRGYRILERNYVYGHKEIDIIAKKGDLIAFVEVKARTSTFFRPYLAVDRRKRHNIIIASQVYLHRNDITKVRIRYDIAEVNIETKKINYLRNAFSDRYSFN